MFLLLYYTNTDCFTIFYLLQRPRPVHQEILLSLVLGLMATSLPGPGKVLTGLNATVESSPPHHGTVYEVSANHRTMRTEES